MRNEYFLQAIDEVKNLGYNVYVLAKYANKSRELTYCFIEDKDGHVGYMQAGDYGGIRYGTVHKANKVSGTGFALQDWTEVKYETRKEDIEESFQFAPEWVSEEDRKSVKKYSSFAEYMKINYYMEYTKY